MNRERVVSFLNRPSPSPELDAFCKYMRPRQHSREETLELWGIFVTGYCAAVDDLEAREKALAAKADSFRAEVNAATERIDAKRKELIETIRTTRSTIKPNT